MIAEFSRPAVIWRSRACPAIVGPGTALGPGVGPAAHPPRHPSPRLPPPRIADRVVFDKLIQVLVFGCGYRRIADHSCSATTLGRRRDEWISAGSPSSSAWRCWPPMTSCSAWSWSSWRWTAAPPRHPAAARPPDPAQGPPQARPQALGGGRSGRHPVGGAAGPGQPSRRRAAGGDPGRHGRSVRCPPSRWCTWTPARTTSPAGRSWPSAAWWARSPPVGGQPRSRSVAAG
jgi:hypothetical protein